MEGPTTELATSTPAPEPSAPADATESTQAPPRSSEGAPAVQEATQESDDFDAVVIERLKNATPEQRKRALGVYDPDEAIELDERLSGKLGGLAQTQAARLREAERRQEQMLSRLNKRQQAIQNRDPDAALEILTEDTQELLTGAQREQTAKELRWQASLLLYEAAPPEVKKALAGKQYSNDPEESGRLFGEDLVKEIEKRAYDKARKELEPILRKELAGQRADDEPTPDLGTGGAPARSGNWKSLGDLRADIKRMSPQEYARREAEIDAAVARFQGRGRAA